MKSLVPWMYSSKGFIKALRWLSLALFLASLATPTGFMSDGIGGTGLGAWAGSFIMLRFAIKAISGLHFSLGEIIRSSPGEIIRFIVGEIIPLAGIANFFFLICLILWNRRFRWWLFIVLCIGIVIQLLIMILPLGPELHAGQLGIACFLWIASFFVAALGMIFRYWLIKNSKFVDAISDNQTNLGLILTIYGGIIALFVCALMLSSCKSKQTLDPGEAKYVHTALDLMRTRADFSAEIAARRITDDARKKDSLTVKDSIIGDSVRFNASLDSVYRRDGVNRQQLIDWTTQLADDPKRAAAYYQVLNDSMAGK